MTYFCVNCGWERHEHNVNLVNEPVLPKRQWFEKRKKGYRMCILTCMETPLTPAYTERIKTLGLYERACGYVSPEPEAEDRERSEKLTSAGGERSFLIVYNPNNGTSALVEIGG